MINTQDYADFVMPAHLPLKTAQFQSLLPGHTQDGDQGMEELPSCFWLQLYASMTL